MAFFVASLRPSGGIDPARGEPGDPPAGFVNVHSGGLVKRSVCVPGRSVAFPKPEESADAAGSFSSITPSLSRSAQIVCAGAKKSVPESYVPLALRSR